jgi:Flp pilus assembly protein CpaB
VRSDRRSTILVLIGVLVFAVGVAVAVVAARATPRRAAAATPARSAATRLGTAGQAVTHATPSAAPASGTPGLFPVPKGAVALAVQLPYVPGVAGYVHAGEAVDVFGVAKDVPQGPMAKLVLSDVEVLAVTGAGPGSSTGTETYVLALTPQQAEQVVYLASLETLYLALAPPGAPPVATSGVNPTNALRAS